MWVIVSLPKILLLKMLIQVFSKYGHGDDNVFNKLESI